MPANTSTPTGLRSEAHPWEGAGWRAVEAQHRNATLGLTHGSLQDQKLLEDIIEETKPALPADAQGLHYLLSTPFRHRPRPPQGSRFRGRLDPGVFYGAEDVKTACAEAGYWRLRFWMDSAGLSGCAASIQMTLFEFHGSTGAMIDLTKPPLADRRADWTHASDYRHTQGLASEARLEGIGMIRYESVRNSPDGRCLAILSPGVFAAAREPYRHNQQSWSLFIQPPRLTVWQRSLTTDSFEFAY
jgi:hypothetical protein